MSRKRGSEPRLENGKYRVRWTDHTGRRHSKVFDTTDEGKKAARKFLRDQSRQVEDIIDGFCSPQRLTDKKFSELFEWWMKNRAPEKRTCGDMKCIINKHLAPAFGHVRLRDFHISLVDAYVAERRGRLSVSTIGNQLTLFITMYRAAKYELNWISDVPLIKKPKDPTKRKDRTHHILRDDHEIGRFLSAARDEGEHVFVLYATAVYTGMRIGELAGLHWRNVDLIGRHISIEQSFHRGPKTDHGYRDVPIFDVLLPVLRAWRLKCHGDLVFPNQRGGMLGESSRVSQEIFQRVLDRAGFPKIMRKGKLRGHITFHDLRHSFACQFLMRGGSIHTLKELLGHADIAMTMHYSRYARRPTSEDVARFGKELPIHVEQAGVIEMPLRA